MLLVERENFDRVHAVRVPLSDGQQSAATPTAVHRLRVLDGIFVREKITNVRSGRVEHANSRAVVGNEDIASEVDRQAAWTSQSAAVLLPWTA